MPKIILFAALLFTVAGHAALVALPALRAAVGFAQVVPSPGHPSGPCGAATCMVIVY